GRPRPRAGPAAGPLGAGQRRPRPGRPAQRRAGHRQVAPALRGQGPPAQGPRRAGRPRGRRVAWLAALRQQRLLSSAGLPGARPRPPPGADARGAVAPRRADAGPPRPRPGGGGAAFRTPAVAAAAGALPGPRAEPAAAQTEHAGAASRSAAAHGGGAAAAAAGGGPALGGSLHAGAAGPGAGAHPRRPDLPAADVPAG